MLRNLRCFLFLTAALLLGAVHTVLAQSDSLLIRLEVLKSPAGALDTGIVAIETGPAKAAGHVEVHSTRSIDSLEKSMRGVQRLEGFRVQVFLGSYREAMEARRKFSESGLAYPSYTLPNTPDYMVLVGDFRTRSEAQRALKEIKRLYTGAFILPGVIEPPQFAARKGEGR